MINKIILIACLLVSLLSFSQAETSSPYSFYGIGEARFKGSIENRSMGGLSIMPSADSIHLNLQNPAAFSNLKTTTFSVGGTYSSKLQTTDTQSGHSQRSALDYIAVGLPLGKFGALGFGLMPFTSVGYKIKHDATDITQNNQRVEGWGGTNKVFLGVGYKILNNLSIGVDAQYNFGKIETNSFEYITDVIMGSRELNTSTLSGLNFDIAMMYEAKINKKLNFYSSLSFTPTSNLTSNNTRNIATVFDSQIVDPVDITLSPTRLKLPNKYSLGAGIGNNEKWMLGAEISLQDVGSLINSYNTSSNVVYEKYTKYSIGGFYKPNSNSFSNYARRITYRGGFKYEKTGLVMNSQSINDIGVNLGFGMPINGSFSNINLGLEMGKKGTTKAGLVQENYFGLNVGFSLNDKWFVKRKFD